MALTVLSGIPATLVVGDAVSFKVTKTDFPASIWTSQILFKSGPTEKPIPFTGTVSGADHLFALTNANTATLKPGRNQVCVLFSDGTNRQSSDWSDITILPNPAAAESKSFAQSQVDLLQKVVTEFNGTAKSSVNFNGQSFQRANIADYQKQLTYYEARVIREQRASDVARGVARPRIIAPQFFVP